MIKNNLIISVKVGHFIIGYKSRLIEMMIATTLFFIAIFSPK
jgi:hypothetical protein